MKPTSGDSRTVQQHDSLLTTDLLLHRLHTGLGIAGGARGSLTKCATSILRDSVKGGDGGGDTTTNSSSISSSITELQLQQLEMTKLFLATKRNAAEIHRLEQEQQQQQQVVSMHTTITTDMEQANSNTSTDSRNATIVDLRNELEYVQQKKLCLEEYEAMAKLIVEGHCNSTQELKQQIANVEAQQRQADTDLSQATAACKIRQAQFHALQQCIADLSESLQERPFVLQPEEVEKSTTTNNPIGVAGDFENGNHTDTTTDNMDVDKDEKVEEVVVMDAKPEGEEEDERDMLYDDL